MSDPPITKIYFSLLIYNFVWAWPKGACRMQTDKQTNKQSLRPTPRIGEHTNRQTDRRSLSPTPKNWRTDRSTDRQTKNRQGAGSANSGAYYIPVLTPD